MTISAIPALVIRESEYKENDKLLTLLTAEKGKITVVAKGAKSLKNKYMAASQLLCYGEYVIKERGGFYTLSDASLIRQFFNVRQSLETYAASQYVAEVANTVCLENSDESQMLSLCLNTLHKLCSEGCDTDITKAVFELRCASLLGFAPDLDACSRCGNEKDDRIFLDVMNGEIVCGDCFISGGDQVVREELGTATIVLPLNQSVIECMRYVISCPPKRIFSFTLPEDDNALFCAAAEKYLINHLERSFATLDFYHKIK